MADVEPWILEQLQLLQCPTCGKELSCLHSVHEGVRFYTCMEAPALHRWALTEEK
jgi:hypothetical protein